MSRSFWIILIAAFALRIVLLAVTPLDDQPAVVPYFNDERAHLNYVRYIDVHDGLPVQTTSIQNDAGFNEYEFYQAPLYYTLSRPFYSLGHTLTPGSEVFWVRFASVLFSLAGIIALYFAVRRFFGDRSALMVLIMAAFAGVPLRFGYLVSNDSLLFAVAGLYFALILHIVHEGCDRRFFWAGVIVAAAGLWTKASFLVMLPLLPCVLLCRPAASRWKAAAGLLLPLIAVAPWYYRNLMLYGTMIPLRIGFGTTDPVSAENWLQRFYYTANYFVRSFHFPYDGLWGGTLDALIYPLLGLAAILFVVYGFRSLYSLNRLLFWLFAAAVALNAASYLWFNTQYFQSEARLLMPGLPFLILVLTAGTVKLGGAEKTAGYILLGIWLLLPWVGAVV